MIDRLVLEFHQAGLFLEEELRAKMRALYMESHSFRYWATLPTALDKKLLEGTARTELKMEAEELLSGP